MKEIIMIQVSDYLTYDLAEKIALARWGSAAPEFVNNVRYFNFCKKYDSEYFNVVATAHDNSFVGHLTCIKNKNDPSLWYYGDLFVIPEFRRAGIATRLIEAAVNSVRENGAKALRCYVEPENTPSIDLQKTLGFREKPFQTFDDLTNDGQLMFELDITSLYSAVPYSQIGDPRYIMMFHRQNMEALHSNVIRLAEWKEILSREDADEEHYLICKGCVPVAWLKLNGLDSGSSAWISMLVVSDKYQRQGAGSFAVQFAEKSLKARGFCSVRIMTTQDNIAAQSLYTKLGYSADERRYVTGDGIERDGFVFEKSL